LKKQLPKRMKPWIFVAANWQPKIRDWLCILRAAALQAFEFTYEPAIKTLKRFLEKNEPNPLIIDEMSFNDLVRRGYEAGLLQAELVAWKQFRKDRSTTSHAYDELKALEVFAGIPAFLVEAKHLIAKITRRQETSFGG
jgi:nucleotidyltransferase substrate binding protein (TIGR01987 family)